MFIPKWHLFILLKHVGILLGDLKPSQAVQLLVLSEDHYYNVLP